MRPDFFIVAAALAVSACATDELQSVDTQGDDLVIRAESLVMMSEVHAFAEKSCSGDTAIVKEREERASDPDGVFWRYICLRTPPGLPRRQDQR